MLHAAIYDMRLLDPIIESICATGHLGYHAAGDGALFDQPVHLSHGNTGKQRSLIVFHAFDISQQDQFFRRSKLLPPYQRQGRR